MKKDLHPKVNIRKLSKGFMIHLEDEITRQNIAVTREELRLIVLYGEIVLKDFNGE